MRIHDDHDDDDDDGGGGADVAAATDATKPAANKRKRTLASMRDAPRQSFATQGEWRTWLMKHHDSSIGLYIVFYKLATGIPSITYGEALDEALCFGWIDSIKRSLDDQRYEQYFCPRTPNSGWSNVNKAKIAELVLQPGRIHAAGTAAIEKAKRNGSWDKLQRETEAALANTAMLDAALDQHPDLQSVFQGYSDKKQRMIRVWVGTAKREETLRKRVDQVVSSLRQGRDPLRP